MNKCTNSGTPQIQLHKAYSFASGIEKGGELAYESKDVVFAGHTSFPGAIEPLRRRFWNLLLLWTIEGDQSQRANDAQ